MKQLLMVSIIMAGSVLYSKAQTTDFRGFSWGNSLDNIQSGEKAHLISKINDDELAYKDELGGSDCDVLYIFNDNDKLESGMYIFSKKYSNPELYLQDYKKFKALLTQKYGKPANEKENWNNHTPVDDKLNYGQAVADGNLTMTTLWNTGRSVVKIALVSLDKHPSLQIHYTASSLDELENKEELKSALNKL